MQSFTAMSEEAIRATIERMRLADEPTYSMQLSGGDFTRLMWALKVVSENAEVNDLAPAYLDLADWAAEFASSIATTFDIEMV